MRIVYDTDKQGPERVTIQATEADPVLPCAAYKIEVEITNIELGCGGQTISVTGWGDAKKRRERHQAVSEKVLASRKEREGER